MMDQLPASLSDPLRYPEPPSLASWTAIAVALALIALWWLFQRWRRRRAAVPGSSPPIPARGRGPVAGGIAATIRAIRSGYGRSKDYRGGCHALSGALRDPVGARLGRPLESATAGEVSAAAEAHGQFTLSLLFTRLAALQFGRREPRAKDFYEVCDLALETVAGDGR